MDEKSSSNTDTIEWVDEFGKLLIDFLTRRYTLLEVFIISVWIILINTYLMFCTVVYTVLLLAKMGYITLS